MLPSKYSINISESHKSISGDSCASALLNLEVKKRKKEKKKRKWGVRLVPLKFSCLLLADYFDLWGFMAAKCSRWLHQSETSFSSKQSFSYLRISHVTKYNIIHGKRNCSPSQQKGLQDNEMPNIFWLCCS